LTELIVEGSQLPLSPLAAVPEIAIDEYRQLLRVDYDVGLAG